MRKTILILLLGVVIFGCNKNDNELLDKIDSYPLEVGNEWTYKIESILKEYDSESFNKIINIDTIIIYSKVSIIKDTVLNDTIPVKQVRTIINSTTNYRYVNIDSDGLKEYGYLNQGFYDIHINEIPKLEIKLPLKNHAQWICYYPQGLLLAQSEKEVIGSDVLKIYDKEYLCYKIEKYFDNYTGVKIYEWISKEGLIKSQEIYDNSESSFINGTKIYIQLTNTTTLTDLKLN